MTIFKAAEQEEQRFCFAKYTQLANTDVLNSLLSSSVVKITKQSFLLWKDYSREDLLYKE